MKTVFGSNCNIDYYFPSSTALFENLVYSFKTILNYIIHFSDDNFDASFDVYPYFLSSS